MTTEQPEDTSGIGRRTIMAGAAWTIPAIAIATAAPAYAAASGMTLEFNQASYSGTLCTAISGAYVTASIGGVPSAGQSVSLSLSNGFAFENGLTSYTGTTGSNGRVNIPTIRVKTEGATGTVSATAAGASQSAAVTSAASAGTQSIHYRPIGDSSANQDRTAPAGSIVVGPSTYLDPNGTLNAAGTVLSTTATSAFAGWTSGGIATVTYIDATGLHYRPLGQPSANQDRTAPAGSIVVGPNAYLDPNGTVGTGAGNFGTTATSARVAWTSAGVYTVTYIDATC